MLDRVDALDLAEMEAEFIRSPWGEERADLRAGIIASTVANVHRNPKRRAEPFSAADFMPRYGEAEEADDDEVDQEALAARINTVMGLLGGQRTPPGDVSN